MADYNSREEFFKLFPKKHLAKVEALFPADKNEFTCDDYILAYRRIEEIPTQMEAEIKRATSGMRHHIAAGGYSSKKYNNGDIIKTI